MYTVYTLRFPDGTRFVGLTSRGWDSATGYKGRNLMSANPRLYDKIVSSGGWDHVQWNVLGENYTKEEAYQLRKEYVDRFKQEGVWFEIRRRAIPSRVIPEFLGNVFTELEKRLRDRLRTSTLKADDVELVEGMMLETTQELYDKYYRGEV